MELRKGKELEKNWKQTNRQTAVVNGHDAVVSILLCRSIVLTNVIPALRTCPRLIPAEFVVIVNVIRVRLVINCGCFH